MLHFALLQVVERIINDVLPVVRQSGLAGHAEYVTRSPFFTEHPVAIDMLVDVLTDRWASMRLLTLKNCLWDFSKLFNLFDVAKGNVHLTGRAEYVTRSPFCLQTPRGNKLLADFLTEG
jgi:hypothetical protein